MTPITGIGDCADGDVAMTDGREVRIENYGPSRDRCWFKCPKKPGYECHVLLKPWPINANTWDWDRNEEAPTLTPSINCNGGPGSCGWHGFIQQGKVVGT